MELLGQQGKAALAAAALEADPDSLAAATRLRKTFPAELAAAALTQVKLRRKAKAKFTNAEELFFTPVGLEQATREPVANWRATRFKDAGISQVWDLGCGIGADAMALQRAGIQTQGVELDPATAEIATANLAPLGAPPVLVGAAQDVEVPETAGVFLDPARRTGAGRSWRIEDFQPPWSLVTNYLASQRFCCVKLGPGMPKELIPDQVQAVWVSHQGQVVEASLWNQLAPGPVAVVFPKSGAAPIELGKPAIARKLPVGPIGRFILEPDNAVIRAGLVSEIAPQSELSLLAEHIAYLTSDDPVETALANCFEVHEVLDLDLSSLRRYVQQHRIGILEIKQRALGIDPAELRRKLRPKGPNQATLILARTDLGGKAMVVKRLPER